MTKAFSIKQYACQKYLLYRAAMTKVTFGLIFKTLQNITQISWSEYCENCTYSKIQKQISLS